VLNFSAYLSFIGILARRLVDKGVFSRSEMADLFDAWFREVFVLGAEFEAEGEEQDFDDILQMIHLLTVEFDSE